MAGRIRLGNSLVVIKKLGILLEYQGVLIGRFDEHPNHIIRMIHASDSWGAIELFRAQPVFKAPKASSLREIPR